MTHFVGLVLIDKNKVSTLHEIQNQLDELLKHWSESRQVEPYKSYETLGDITSMLFYYMKNERKEEAALEKLKDLVPKEVYEEKRLQYIDGTEIKPSGGDLFRNIPDKEGMPEPISKRVSRLLKYVEANPPTKPADFDEKYEGHWGRKYRNDLLESAESGIEELEKLETLQDFLTKKAIDWSGDEMYIEQETSRVYRWSRYNKEGKWDWWVIGSRSRWYDVFPQDFYNLDNLEDRKKLLNGVFECSSAAPDEWKKKWDSWDNSEPLPDEYKAYHYPSVLVCDGEWLSRKDWGWFGTSTETTTLEDWNKKVNEKLDAHPNHIAVAVDFHV